MLLVLIRCVFSFSEPECQIIDFVTQQHKLFIGIATCHALKMTATKLWDTFNEVQHQLRGGNLERLPEVSHCSSGSHWVKGLELTGQVWFKGISLVIERVNVLRTVSWAVLGPARLDEWGSDWVLNLCFSFN